MRFSVVQEENYGIGLEQEQFLDVIDESMMAATEDTLYNNCGSSSGAIEEGSMISNLPLLFASGYPTSLEKITLPELERFITFMVQCSLGHDTSIGIISEPQWWPKEIKFSNPLVRPKKMNDMNVWLGSLKKLVFRCYTYHRSEYLLRFCSHLAQYPFDKLEFVNNWDSTTSLYIKGTGKLLVTFRNENMNYDRKIESPRKSLLPYNGVNSTLSNGLKRQKPQQQFPLTMVQPPVDDIYLCDNCDAELVGYEQMRAHEKMCCDPEQNNGGSRPATPEDACMQPEIKQDQFLEYFKLYSSKPPPLNPTHTETAVKSATNNGGSQIRSSRRIRGSVNFTRCPTIPFSSPAGIALAKKSKAMTEEVQLERLERLERHLTAPSLSNSCRPKWLDRYVLYDGWIVTYKANRDRQSKDDYVHKYSFNSFKGKPALSLRSQLLYIACRPARVLLTCLNTCQINELKKDPSKYIKYTKHIRRLPRPGPKPLSRKNKWGKSSLNKAPFLGNVTKLIAIDNNEMQFFDQQSKKTIQTVPTEPAENNCQNHQLFLQPQLNSSPQTLVSSVIRNKGSLNTKNNVIPTSTNIIVVDLCSSDEDDEMKNSDNGETQLSSDENRDPMRLSSDVRSPIFNNITPRKLCSKPCVYPADSTSDWLSNADNTDTTNILRSRARFSSIKQTP